MIATVLSSPLIPQSNLPAVPAGPDRRPGAGEGDGGWRGGRRAVGGAVEECPGDAN